jgi:CO/xanthine dehydrogenase FAD-binding subunit
VRKLRPFEYFRPASLDEALEVLATYGERGRVLAGGTDVLVSMKRRRQPIDALVDLKRIRSLDHLTWTAHGGFRMGALFTVAAVARSAEIQARLGLLRTAALAIGHPQVRTRATVAGNLCNGSPSADFAPSLLALDAQVHIARAGGTRVVPLTEFYTGSFKTVVAPDEIVVEIVVPSIDARSAGHYAWLPKVTTVDETLVGAAAVVSMEDGRNVRSARIALGSTAPTPIRAWKAEEFLRGQRMEPSLFREAARIAAGETSPRRRAAYRTEMTCLLLERSLRHAWQAAG